MEVKGKIIKVLPETSGVSRNGNPWKKKEYVLETFDTYPRKVHFTCFGDKADQIVLTEGQNVTVSFDLESREYNNRWYTDVRAWKVDIDQAGAGAPVPPSVNMAASVPNPPVQPAAADDEFPF
ncbi:MAG: DUF3127 domain-containing protein [Muribaculaceae bacterium]|nr:DUF3127 domain-containing protein [Muribaculaceae bacterium]